MKKKFDCVQMKRLGAEQVRKQTAVMTREQELRFWQERSQFLRHRQEALQAQSGQILPNSAFSQPLSAAETGH